MVANHRWSIKLSKGLSPNPSNDTIPKAFNCLIHTTPLRVIEIQPFPNLTQRKTGVKSSRATRIGTSRSG